MKIITVVLGEMLNNNQVELSGKQFDLIFLWIFKIVSIEQLFSIFLDFGMQLLKMIAVKQHENHHSGTWGDAEQ